MRTPGKWQIHGMHVAALWTSDTDGNIIPCATTIRAEIVMITAITAVLVQPDLHMIGQDQCCTLKVGNMA